MPRFLPVLLLGLVTFPVLAQGNKEKGTKYAFIVAVSKYDEETSGLKPLPFTVKDVEGFRNALLATGYEAKNIRMLHDRLTEDQNPGLRLSPEKNKIMAELGRLIRVIDPDDSLMVVLNGHGVHFKGSKTSHFCPLDTDLSNKENLLPLDGEGGLYPLLEKCTAKSKLLIAGMCRNDPKEFPAKNQAATLIDLNAPETPPEGIAALYSCKAGQMTYFDPKTGSYFFNHLSAAWRGEYAGEEELTLDTVFASVCIRTKKEVFDSTGGLREQFPEVRRKYDGVWNIPKAVRREPKGGEEREFEIFKDVKMRFCWIPSGDAQMGSPKAEQDYVTKTFFDDKRPTWMDGETETARGRYKTKGFWLGKYEVLQSEWQGVMGDNPSNFKGAKLPVEMVSWADCQKFIGKCGGKGMKLKLPHEDEWEYACRGGKGNNQAFYWGDVLNGNQANCDGNYPYGTTAKGPYKEKTTEVGNYEKMALHPWGLCDMAGNVWEWCDNKHSDNSQSLVLRGGSWHNFPRFCRSAYRNDDSPDYRGSNLGFRLALVP